ncbi:MAG: nickel-dependent lactate racemase [Candidatus Brocadiia bacterium]
MKPMIMPFGKSSIKLNLPARPGCTVLRARPIPPVKNIISAVSRVLDNSSGTKPFNKIFRPDDKIAIVVPDKTRRCGTDLILNIFIRRLAGIGVPLKNITVILARGLHSAHKQAEIKRIVGRNRYGKIRIVDHDCRNKDELVYIGRTSFGTRLEINRWAAEADKVITLGVVQYHYFAGFSGGRKMILPGIAGYDAINQNHSLVLNRLPGKGKNPMAALGQMSGNPVNEDMIEAARMFKVSFAVNLVVNHHEDIIKVFGGDIIKSHRSGCDFVNSFGRVILKKPADLVVASAGGYPTDINYIQAHKTIEHCSKALKTGGSMLVLAECPEGVGSDIFVDYLKYGTAAKMEQQLRGKYVVSGQTAMCSLIKARKFDIHIHSRIPVSLLKKMKLKPAANPQSVLNKLLSTLPDNARILVFPEGHSLMPVIKP